MIGVLFEDGISRLDGLLVLFRLILFDQRLEQIRFLLGQWPSLTRLRVVVAVAATAAVAAIVVVTRHFCRVSLVCPFLAVVGVVVFLVVVLS